MAGDIQIIAYALSKLLPLFSIFGSAAERRNGFARGQKAEAGFAVSLVGPRETGSVYCPLPAGD